MEHLWINFFKNLKNTKQLIDNGGYCIVSNKISVDSNKIGYCYKEKVKNETDSGWRFFAGDEDDNYCNNPENFNIFDINTICNYDQSILEILNETTPSSFIKEGEKFIPNNEIE